MNKRHARGFTLIELIIFIVVISVGLTGIMLVVNTVVASSADPLVRKQSVSIAESMLAEILMKDYANPEEGYTGTIRSLFEDIGDYAGYSTSAGIADQSGLPVPGLTSYNFFPPVRVTATADLAGVPAFKVTVSVTGPLGVISLTGYRASY